MPRILIADDNESVRNALRDVLSQQNGWSVCGEAMNGRSAVSLALEMKPDLVILDFLMPLMNGLAAAAEISREMPDVPIVLYTMHKSEQLEREAKKVGIKKVISKVGPFDDFVADLSHLLSDGEAPVGPLGLSDNYASSDAPGDVASSPGPGAKDKSPKEDSRP
jgi:DNA-binding NarL/FixJ family response regulator